MTCNDWEERVALYAGGDLPLAEAAEVERHLAECAGCQLLLSGLRESLGLLHEAYAEPVDAAHFAAVRTRVLSELEGGRRRWWLAAWAFAAVAAAILLLVMVRPSAKRPPTVALTPAPPAAIAPIPETAPVVRPPNRSVAKAVRREGKPSETVLVKLETNDPDVVIYWLAESKGEPK